jgi:hypothetical protein
MLFVPIFHHHFLIAINLIHFLLKKQFQVFQILASQF